MKFQYTSIQFKPIEYKYNVNFRINEINYIDTHGDTLTITAGDGLTVTTGDFLYFDGSSHTLQYHPVENNILDLLSQELDVEINKEMMLKLLEMAKNDEDNRNEEA